MAFSLSGTKEMSDEELAVITVAIAILYKNDFTAAKMVTKLLHEYSKLMINEK